MKWLLTLILAVVLLGLCAPALVRRFRLGRLPGDVVWRRGGREYVFPFTSTVLLSLLVAALSRLL